MRLKKIGVLGFAGVFMCMVGSPWSDGAERICSVYLESTSALQQQIQQASQAFESPEMGMLPMMIMMMPGGSQVNVSEPISLHVFDMGNGKTGGLVELTPGTTAEMFLKSLIAASGQPLAEPVDGRYQFEGGVAQMRGTRLLLAKSADELDALTGGAVPALPPMPNVPGVIRVAIAPSAVVPMIEMMQRMVLASMPADDADAEMAQARDMLDMVFGLYTRTLAQINTVNLGLGVKPEGLLIQSQLVPTSGSTVADIIHSMQAVDPAFLGFVDGQSLFSIASGHYSISDQLKGQLVRLYIRMLKSTPMPVALDYDEVSFAMRESIESLGASMAFSLDMPNAEQILMQGAMGVLPAVSYLEKMVALTQMPGMMALTENSGVKMEAPQKRMYKEFPVYEWRMRMDEATFRKQMSAHGQPIEPEAFEMVNKMMKVFTQGYAYAATPKGVTFGLGASNSVEQATDRFVADAVDLAEVNRIRGLLSPAASPVVIGRLDLLGTIRLGAKMVSGVGALELPEPVSNLPEGEGIVFADWLQGSEVHTALLMPTHDIKALVNMSKAIQAETMAAMTEAGESEDAEGMDAVEEQDPSAK